MVSKRRSSRRETDCPVGAALDAAGSMDPASTASGREL